ncbi:transposase, MuDR, MULE transposase domain protein [Tanacetum coccineum]
MKRLPVKSILWFRTVSKEWKSCIDFINFQKTYGIHSSNDCCMILRYNHALPSYMLSLDHNLTYSPLVIVCNDSNLLPVGTCHVPAFNSQPKSDKILLGFGVRPDIIDPTIIKVSYPRGGHGSWYVSVLTLSSIDWKKLDNDCLPRESIRFKCSSQVHDIDVVFRDDLTVLIGLLSLGNSLILSGSINETDFYLFVAKVARTIVHQVSYECGGFYQYNLVDVFLVSNLLNFMPTINGQEYAIILDSDYDSPHSMNYDDTWEPRKDVTKNTSKFVIVKGRKGSTSKKVSCSKSTKTKPFKDLMFFDDSSSDDQGNVFRGKPVESDVELKVVSVPDVVDAKRPPPVRNCILGLASLRTWQKNVQKDFDYK